MRNVRYLSILLLSTVLLLVACKDNQTEKVKNNNIIPVETDEIKTGDLMIESSIYGKISPQKQTPVLTQAGEITDLIVKTGDEIKKDDRIGTVKTEKGNFTIYSPADGEISQLNLETNDFYNGEEPLAIVFNNDKVNVNFSITTRLANYFNEKEEIKVIVENKEYKGKLETVDRLPNESGQFTVIAKIDNEKGTILPGSIAEIIVEEVVEKDSLIVPTESIVIDSDEAYVFIVSDNRAKKINVTILNSQTELTAIEADIEEKSEIIVSGQFLLENDSEIKIVKEGK